MTDSEYIEQMGFVHSSESDFSVVDKSLSLLGLTSLFEYHKKPKMTRFFSLSYTILCGIVSLLAVPYFFYITRLTGASPGPGASFLIFMIVCNLPPPLCWFFGLIYVSKGRHKDLFREIADTVKMQLSTDMPLLRKSSYKYFTRDYFIVSIIMSLILFVIYGIWMWRVPQWDDDLNSPLWWKIFCVSLVFSFPLRLVTPFVVCFLFVLECHRLLHKAEKFVQPMSHMRRLDATELTIKHQELCDHVDQVHEMRGWTMLMWGLVIAPIANTFLLMYHVFSQLCYLLRGWFFIVYAAHYYLVSFALLYEASNVSYRLSLLPQKVNTLLGKNEFMIEGSSTAIEAFMWLLEHKKLRMRVVGLDVNKSTLHLSLLALGIIVMTATEVFLSTIPGTIDPSPCTSSLTPAS